MITLKEHLVVHAKARRVKKGYLRKNVSKLIPIANVVMIQRFVRKHIVGRNIMHARAKLNVINLEHKLI